LRRPVLSTCEAAAMNGPRNWVKVRREMAARNATLGSIGVWGIPPDAEAGDESR